MENDFHEETASYARNITQDPQTDNSEPNTESNTSQLIDNTPSVDSTPQTNNTPQSDIILHEDIPQVDNILQSDTTLQEDSTSFANTPQTESTPQVYPTMAADFTSPAKLFTICDEYQQVPVSGGNFLKGVKWSPDGTCFLTCSEDNVLRVFETPQQPQASIVEEGNETIGSLNAVLSVKKSETIYDYNWYPAMNADPSTACFVSTSRDHPVQLWDAFTGKLRCAYRKYDQMDEIASAYGTCFNVAGDKIYCGFNGELGYFYTNRPGRDFTKVLRFDKKSQSGIPGIISCFASCSACPAYIACGSYSGYAGIVDDNSGDHIAILTDPSKKMNGVTQVLFSRDGWSLYVGCRKSSEILCWDLRYITEEPYLRLSRRVDTNQRISFDTDWSGRYLISGTTQNGAIVVYDTTQNGQIVSSPFPNQQDTVNGVAVHPHLPLLAVSTGQRSFAVEGDSESDKENAEMSEQSHANATPRNGISLWQFNSYWTYPSVDTPTQASSA